MDVLIRVGTCEWPVLVAVKVTAMLRAFSAHEHPMLSCMRRPFKHVPICASEASECK